MRICVAENDDLAFTGICANLRSLRIEVVRIRFANELQVGDLVIQGSGPVMLTHDASSRIELVGQADDEALMAALGRSDFVLERPFEPGRLLEVVQEVGRTAIPLRNTPFFVAQERLFELNAVASRPNATARDFAEVVSKDLGLSLLVFRLAGSVSSLQYYPTISGSIVRIGIERFSRIVRSGAVDELVNSQGTHEVELWQAYVLRLAEVARAYIPDELLAAVAYIVTILSVLPEALQTSISASGLVRLLDGPKVWIDCLQELEEGNIDRPVPAAIYAAEHRLARRARTAVFNLRSAG